MPTIDKKDYYKVGAELLNANIEFGLPHSRREGYFFFLLEQLAHACFQKYEKEFSKAFAKRVENLIIDTHKLRENKSYNTPKGYSRHIFSTILILSMRIESMGWTLLQPP